MGKDPHYLYLQGWWPYILTQQVIFSTQVEQTIVSCVNSHSCKNPPLRHMTDSRKTSGNMIFIDLGMDFTYFGKTVQIHSYFLKLEKNWHSEI